MKIKFITFADGNYGIRAAGRRIEKSARSSGHFNSTRCFTLKDLLQNNADSFQKHFSYVQENPRGLGNLIWKPFLVRQELKTLESGEILLYLDAGCQFNFNVKSTTRWKEYLELVQLSGGLFMQLKNFQFGFQDLTEIAWTRKTLLDKLNIENCARLQNQVQAGILFLMKTPVTELLVDQWLDECIRDSYFALEDSNSIDITEQDFKAHRFEQSVFSILVKQTNLICIPDETYWAPDWRTGLDFPIWAMRNRSGGDAYQRNLIDNWKLSIAKIARALNR